MRRHEERAVPQQPTMDFAALYEQARDPVLRYVLARVGNRADADDITAQAFLAAYEARDRYRGDAPFVAWVIGIARRKIADHYRRRRDNVPLSDMPAVEHPAPQPEAAVVHQLEIERVARALHALSPERQEAVAMRLFGGLSNPDIAAVMDKTPQAVAMLVHRGLQDLKTRLAEGATDHDA